MHFSNLLTDPAIVAVCFLLFGMVHAKAEYVDPVCLGFDGKTRQEAASYLKQDPAKLEPICIEKALRVLAAHLSPPLNVSEKEIFLQYIDFKVERPKEIPLPVRLGPTAGEYLGADALTHFGTWVIPDLKTILIDDHASKRSRINAAKVYFGIEPHAPTIAFVSNAGRDAGDRDAGEELAHLASLMVAHCAKDEQDACKNALGN